MADNKSAELARRLDGQVMFIPDLGAMMSHWPAGRNPHGAEVQGMVDRLLEGASEEDKANVAEADPVLLASCFWPEATRERLQVLTLTVTWLGQLDDCLENLESGIFQKAHDFRAKVKRYIALYLQLSRESLEPVTQRAIADFEPIAKLICREYDQDQRRQLKVSLCEYIDSTGHEIRCAQRGEVPLSRLYETMRKKTAGAGPLCALAEFATGMRLPAGVVLSNPYKLMAEAVCVMVGMTNDLLSLGKELRKGRVLSIVPVMLWNNEHDDLEGVVGHVVDKLKKAVRQFEVSETRLIQVYPSKAEHIRQVAAAMKTTCTGNLTWSLASKRYRVGEPLADGSLRLELKAA
ncbi:(-)-delta-cadinene synthase [Colletotrichum sidae]|uniref:Terpene synthase n=1 Tax=Colletotrichum sidae TaxID=1347389 RepID=A0A4R8T4N0_9PEZI|nr:(-)-delta-cadinene synthase [Colletotrichum sidae]